MRLFREVRAFVFMVAVCLCTTSLSISLAQAPDSSKQPGAGPNTISVTSLSVPPEARAHLNKARKAAQEHQQDIFEREITRALDLAPNFAEAYLLLADQENSVNQPEAAIAYALKAREIDPANRWTSILLAIAYNDQRRYSEAFSLLKDLSEREAALWQVQYEMARTEVGLGHVESALHWSNLAVQSAPDSCVDAPLLRANALQLAHRWKEAIAEMEFYLASKSPLIHRAPVELALAHVKLVAEEQDRRTRTAP